MEGNFCVIVDDIMFDSNYGFEIGIIRFFDVVDEGNVVMLY